MFGTASFCETTFTSSGSKNRVTWTPITVEQTPNWEAISTAPTPQQK